jgi:hypothetical protein
MDGDAGLSATFQRSSNPDVSMIDRKNRYGFTAARIHDADGRARRPSSTTIDIPSQIFVREAAKVAQPHTISVVFRWPTCAVVVRKQSAR